MTPYHIREHIGAGGESSLASLFLIWEELYVIADEFLTQAADFH